MGIFTEKWNDALNRSALFINAKWSWWAFKLAKSYDFGFFMFEISEGTALAGAVILWPIASTFIYLILPLFNVISNISLAAINLLISPIVVPFLTLFHMAKDKYYQDKANEFYSEVASWDESTFSNKIEIPLEEYNPSSEISQQLKQAIVNDQRTLKEKKLSLFAFFKQSDDYNAGRGITSHLLSAVELIDSKNRMQAVVFSQRSLIQQELDAEAQRLESLSLVSKV